MCKHGDQSGSSDGINGWYRNIYYTLTIYPAKQATAAEPRATQFFLISFRQHTQIKAVWCLIATVCYFPKRRAGFFLPNLGLETHDWTIPIRHRKKLQSIWNICDRMPQLSRCGVLAWKPVKKGYMCLADVVQLWTKHGSSRKRVPKNIRLAESTIGISYHLFTSQLMSTNHRRDGFHSMYQYEFCLPILVWHQNVSLQVRIGGSSGGLA